MLCFRRLTFFSLVIALLIAPIVPMLLPNTAHAAARMIENVAYGPNTKQAFDVYIPNHAGNAPIIMMVHGGAWHVGDKANKNVIANKVNRWVARGFILVSVNYRLAPAANPLKQTRDIARALATVQKLAVKWGGNPSQVTLMGHSSGAHLVALLTASPRIAASQGAGNWLGSVLIDSAAYDINKIMRGRHARFYDRAFGPNPSFWNKASPISQLQSATRPILAICSTKRRKPCARAGAFTAKARALGTHARLLQVAKNHKQLNKSLGLQNGYTLKVEAFLASISRVNAGVLLR